MPEGIRRTDHLPPLATVKPAGGQLLRDTRKFREKIHLLEAFTSLRRSNRRYARGGAARNTLRAQQVVAVNEKRAIIVVQTEG